jgi:hypothetical protein
MVCNCGGTVVFTVILQSCHGGVTINIINIIITIITIIIIVIVIAPSLSLTSSSLLP